MLDATEDGNDERPASSTKEGSPEAVKADVANRMVYKLVKVRDDGSVLAATEDDVFQSLVGGSENGLSSYDPEGSDNAVGDDDDDDDDDEGSDYVASVDGDDNLSGRATILPIQDLAVERQRLNAQIEVLDCILMRVDLEERRARTLSAEKEVGSGIRVGRRRGREGNPSSTYVNAGDVIASGADYKRQRRPNPKYFDAVYDVAGDQDHAVMMGPSPLSNSELPPMPRPRKLPPRTAVIVSPRVASGWGASHKARSAAHASSFTRKAPSTCKEDSNTMSLDNLSIRELHEAFCSTYGRATSVKDKHWLKRQISAEWLRQQDTTTNSHQNKLKARVTLQAEQPRPTTVLLGPLSSVGDAAQKASEVDHFRDHAFLNRLGSRCFQRRVTTPAVLSRGGSFGILNGSSAPGGQTAIYGEVVNNGDVIEGKRQRKPNRRYIEDETYVASGFGPVLHDTRSFYGETEGHVGLNSTTNYSWRTVETDGSSDIIGRHGTVRGSTKKFSPIQRPKLISSGMKRKVGGRAAKLVKMAHTTARAARHDIIAEPAVVRKAKFQLPAATPDTITNGMISDMNGLAGDRASTVTLPIVQCDPSAGVQPLMADHSRGESEQQALIVTVPTANGGTRRKHHRPWTLREVMTLVEGVARCGGGKWADIKKLAFSTVGYRTAVDLKDKWRNLLRASRAQLHPSKQGERKKQFTAAIPAPILARVRELASLPNQIPSGTVSVSSTSRSGRIVYRK